MSNYAKKADLIDARSSDTLDFSKNTDLSNLKSDELKIVPSGLSNLKSKVDKVGIRKLKTTPIDLSKLSDVVKNEIFKKTKYSELIKKVNNINTTDTSNLLQKQNTKRIF